LPVLPRAYGFRCSPARWLSPEAFPSSAISRLLDIHRYSLVAILIHDNVSARFARGFMRVVHYALALAAAEEEKRAI